MPTELNSFTTQPQVDRAAGAGTLSVYIQEDAPPGAAASPLHVMDFRIGGPAPDKP